MRRWNGWGDEAQTYPLPVSARAYLERVIGCWCSSRDVSLESSLPAHPLVETGQETRLLHAYGQSLPDWDALRSGLIMAFPDGVAYPSSEAEVRGLLGFSNSTAIRLIPYGGGTSVVGHINPFPGEIPSLTVDVSRLSHLLELAETTRLPLSRAVSLQHPRDGRFIFAFPWEEVTLVGTTDIEHSTELVIDPAISPEETEYLRDHLK